MHMAKEKSHRMEEFMMKSNIDSPPFSIPVYSPKVTFNDQAFEFKSSNDYSPTSK